MSDFKPMLAGTVDTIEALTYPLWISPKLDGIRAVVIDGVLLSRNLKPIPNKHLQTLFGNGLLNGVDGELIRIDVPNEDAFRHTTSSVMSEDGEPDNVAFVVFDHFMADGDYAARLDELTECIEAYQNEDNLGAVTLVPSMLVKKPEDVSAMEAAWLSQGFEGVMIRSPGSPYKHGRSTLKEGYLLKLKRFCDSEAEILGFEEQQENTNEKTTDNLGHAKRSTHQAGKKGKGTLGALRVKDIKTGVEFSIGTGFDDQLRAEIWSNWTKYSHKIVKYKYFPTGSKDKPRFPVMLGFRDTNDMST